MSESLDAGDPAVTGAKQGPQLTEQPAPPHQDSGPWDLGLAVEARSVLWLFSDLTLSSSLEIRSSLRIRHLEAAIRFLSLFLSAFMCS
ncbi:hypothetical protein FQN60_007911, partial [Etheostoma spectabile]